MNSHYVPNPNKIRLGFILKGKFSNIPLVPLEHKLSLDTYNAYIPHNLNFTYSKFKIKTGVDLNIIPKLGQTFHNFFGKVLTELFNGIYNQQINPKSAKTVVIGFFIIIGMTTILITSLSNFDNTTVIKKVEIEKPETKEKKKKKEPVKKKHTIQEVISFE